MTDKEKLQALAERVMGWQRPLSSFGVPYMDVWQDSDGQIVSGACMRQWNPLENIADAWMVVERLRDQWTAATVQSEGHSDDFIHPFDDREFFEYLHRSADRRWPWAFLYVTPRAICEAARVGERGEQCLTGGPAPCSAVPACMVAC